MLLMVEKGIRGGMCQAIFKFEFWISLMADTFCKVKYKKQ